MSLIANKRVIISENTKNVIGSAGSALEQMPTVIKSHTSWWKYVDGQKTDELLGLRLKIRFPELDAYLSVKVPIQKLDYEQGDHVKLSGLNLSLYTTDEGEVLIAASAKSINVLTADLLE